MDIFLTLNLKCNIAFFCLSPFSRLPLSLSLLLSRCISLYSLSPSLFPRLLLFHSLSFYFCLFLSTLSLSHIYAHRNGSKKLLRPRTGTPNWSPSTKLMEVPTNILVSFFYLIFSTFPLFPPLSLYICI